jgi:hypothetical protein
MSAPSTFTAKKIAVTFALGQGTFGTSGFDTLKISSAAGQPGPRVSVQIAQAGGDAKGMLNLRMYGLTLSQMNQLSRVGRSLNFGQRQNLVLVEAGDDVVGLAQIYRGSISVGWADPSEAPSVGFIVEAQAGWWEALAPVQANSWQGSLSVDTICRTLALQMNLTYQNWGVETILVDPNLPGNGWQQFRSVLRAADAEGAIDNGALVIWPKGGSRGGQVPTIGPSNIAVGYPRYNATGIALRTLFNPAINLGGQINVQSSLDAATGPWVVNTLGHSLEAQRPGGDWYSTMECSRPGNFVIQGGGSAAP